VGLPSISHLFFFTSGYELFQINRLLKNFTMSSKPHNVEVNENISDPMSTAQTSELGHLANQEDHEVGKLASFRKYPFACAWSLYMVWVVLLVSFENQASGNIIGIPEFRKDFGHEFTAQDGSTSYVVDANWQSAFQGAPVAS
jgi:SP family general alpha glucoside:H+ symporter-like MFS transporter